MLAYLDPGTGSLLIQLIIAAVLSAGVALRRYIFRPIARLFGRGEADEEETEEPEELDS